MIWKKGTSGGGEDISFCGVLDEGSFVILSGKIYTCPFFPFFRVTFGLWESQPSKWQREPPVSATFALE